MKRHIHRSFFYASLFSMPLVSQINMPKAGVVRYRSGAIHPVYGLGSSWVVRSPFVRSSVAAAFSDSFGLVADGASLSLLKDDFSPVAKTSCLDLRPVLGIGDNAESAVAWLPSANALVTFNGKAFVTTATDGLEPGATVTAVGKTGESVRLLLTQANGSVSVAELSLKTGQLKSMGEIAEARGSAAFHLSYICSVYDGKLHLTSADGNGTLEFPLNASAVTFDQSSTASLHITSPGDSRNWIVYAENGHPALAELPAPAGTP